MMENLVCGSSTLLTDNLIAMCYGKIWWKEVRQSKAAQTFEALRCDALCTWPKCSAFAVGLGVTALLTSGNL